MPERPRVPARLRAPVFSLTALIALSALAASAPGTARAVGPPADPTEARPERPGPQLQPQEPRPTGRILVQFRPGAQRDRQLAALTATGLTAAPGAPRLRNIEVALPGRAGVDAALSALRERPDVAFAELEYYRSHQADPWTEPRYAEQWGLNNTGQTINGWAGAPDFDINAVKEVWEVTRGAPDLVVAVIDDGVDFTHPDLAGRQWVNPGESGGGKENNNFDDDGNGFVDDVNGYDFCNDDATVHDADQDWHGTAMASVIAGAANDDGMAGIAPDVKIMAVKFMDNGDTCGTDAQAIAAIQYAAMWPSVWISSNSWGGEGHNSLLEQAIESSGMLFVASAGNSAQDSDVEPVYPAAFDSPNIVSVGAVHNQAWFSSFSNWGLTTVDILAPGEDILTALPRDGIDHCSPPPASGPVPDSTGWSLCSGTSPAAAHVSGVAALAASANPALLPDPVAMRAHLLHTGRPLPEAKYYTVSGRVIDAQAAVASRPVFKRLSGSDRFATAAAVSRATFYGSGFGYVFIATGANFPDALAGGAVGALNEWPLLLVNTNSIPNATKAELTRLKPWGIVILGGPSVVSESVASQLAAYAHPLGGVVRDSGADRFATAAAVATAWYSPGVPTAYIAVGTNFPDALAAAPVNAVSPGPLLLVNTTSIPQATKNALAALQPQRIVILGSTGVVSAGVQTQLDPYTTGPVLRWWGTDRYKTAVAISQQAFQGRALAQADTVFIATGTNFPDALAGGPAGGAFRGPLLLVPGTTVPPEVEAEIVRLNPSRIFLLGGESVVHPNVQAEIEALFP